MTLFSTEYIPFFVSKANISSSIESAIELKRCELTENLLNNPNIDLKEQGDFIKNY